ncbi:MAG: metallophosphatase family protein [Verrucomicrobiae bacterium]|nr:metallophosphatase family protein [Verrucomicrobiae bacterium]NNJ87263.1 metallophosphoesterase family protein [Akkermansiaceae bacterium]
MRFAIVSDIHANLQAWQAVVADMSSLPEISVDHIICLGDIVGYGPDPSRVLQAVREHSSATVIGNHDAAACGRMDTSLFNDNAREVVEWTGAHLSEDDLAYLQQLPEKARPQGAGFLAVHAEVLDPMNFGYILNEADALANFSVCNDRIIFVGHSHRAGVFMQQPSGETSIHEPMDFCCQPDNRYIINPGSIGDPRSTEIVASYAIYDDATGDVFFRRIPFDITSYRRSIDATSLVTRPFFLRHLDEVSSGDVDEDEAIPSVEETDGVPQRESTAVTLRLDKKELFKKFGLWLLLIALFGAAWLFSNHH